jgi:hypothetical protein
VREEEVTRAEYQNPKRGFSAYLRPSDFVLPFRRVRGVTKDAAL